MRVAAVNWKLREIKSEAEFFDHLRDLLDGCRGCDIIVLPEMFGLELATAFSPLTESDLPWIAANIYERIVDGLVQWKIEQSPMPALIVGGSNIRHRHIGNGVEFRNTCEIIHEAVMTRQEKVVLTEWESGIGMSSGAGLTFHSSTRIGITICLDAEFPASGRALAEAGMLFQCVPAWTETMHGFQRVRWACQARAVENQVCVIHSSLVGKVGEEESHGSSAIIVPPHEPFPLNPILAETAMDEEGVAIAEVDPADLLKCREQGEVRNWRDRDAGDWTVTTI